LNCLNLKALETGRNLAHIRTMSETRLKRPRDPAQLAKLMIDIASGEVKDRKPEPSLEGKDAAAVSLGRRGGLKGGKARAERMLPERRAEIARKAAKARWKK
jgi:hypothetical protein